MADLGVDGRQLDVLKIALLDAFPTEGGFSDFLGKAIDGNYSQHRRMSYAETIVPLLQNIEAEGWLRELVRKAFAARPGNQRLRDFVKLRDLRWQSDHEDLITIIEDGGLGWPVVTECLEAAGGDIPDDLATTPTANEEEKVRRLFAQRLGDVVDWLAAQSPDTQLTLKHPLLRFAAQLLRRIDRDDLAYRLRLWIRKDARERGESVVDALIVCADADRQSAHALLEALKSRRVTVDLREYATPLNDAWTNVIQTAKTHIGRTLVLITPETSPQWAVFNEDRVSADSDAEAVRSSIFVVLAGLDTKTATLPRFLPTAPVSLGGARPTSDEAALLVERILHQARLHQTRIRGAESVYVAKLAQDVADRLRKDEVVLLIGPAASWPPTGYALARALLSRPMWRSESVQVRVPADLASTYCALKVGTDKLGDELNAAWSDLSASGDSPENVPRIYKLLARLIDQLPHYRVPIRTLKQESRRQVIVSTNRDLMLERAFLLEGVSFLRIVVKQERVPLPGQPDVSFVFNDYDATKQGTRIRLKDWSVDLDTDAADFRLFDEAIYRSRATEAATVAEVTEKLRGADPERPVLFKYHGSYDHPSGCSITIEDYDLLGDDIVPEEIRKKVQTKPLLLLGYGCTDPELRHLRRTILRGLPESLNARYAVQFPIPQSDDEVDFQIERALEERMGNVWQSANIRNYLIADGSTVVDEILGQLAKLGEGPP